MYRRQRHGWVKHIDFLILDIICMQVAYIIAYVIRHGFSVPYEQELYRVMALILVFFDIFVVLCNESYSGILGRGYYIELFQTFKHVSIVIGLGLIYMFWTQQSSEYSRITFGFMWILNVIISWGVRCIWKNVIRHSRRNNDNSRSLILITNQKDAEEFVNTFCKNNYENIKINGMVILDADKKGMEINGVPVISNSDEILEYLRTHWVDEVFVNIDISFQETEAIENILEKCMEMGITVHTKLAQLAGMSSNQVVETLAGYTVLSSSIAIVTTRQLLAKRALDIVGAVIGCFLTVIAYIFIAPIIKMKSPGPVFFKQTRVGKNGKVFMLYKFRSMYMDAEERKTELLEQNDIEGQLMFKMKDDPRIIKGIGTFIRKYSIDELPQFYNVLRGEMSLVGTRPPTVDEWNKYELHHRKRLAIKPGITGLWQVSGRSDIKNFEQVVALDTKYIADWSFSLDLKILLKTIRVVFKGNGAM